MLYNLLTAQADIIPAITGQTDPATAEKVSKVAQDISELRSLSLQDLVNRLAESAVNFAINLAIAIVVFYVGRFIIRKIYHIISAIFLRRQIDKSLATFVLSLVNMILYFILFVTVIGILGIETTSFLALFASAGVAIGMALSGTLQNFAGGVLILLLKPYKIGDYIEAQGYAGTVSEIQIFHTIIKTPDNKSISIPNGGLSTSSVNNWSRESYRRVDWTVSISYGDDVNAARQAIMAMFDADERVAPGIVMPDVTEVVTVDGAGVQNVVAPVVADDKKIDEPQKKPSLWKRLFMRHRRTKQAIEEWQEEKEARIAALQPKPDYNPKIFVKELGSSSVDLTVRAWTKTENYWSVYFYYNELFYTQLPKAGIHFPFPQLDVHTFSGDKG